PGGSAGLLDVLLGDVGEAPVRGEDLEPLELDPDDRDGRALVQAGGGGIVLARAAVDGDAGSVDDAGGAELGVLDGDDLRRSRDGEDPGGGEGQSREQDESTTCGHDSTSVCAIESF